MSNMSNMYDPAYDFEVAMPERKTIHDVMTVGMAVHCSKSSKNHKLTVRTHKRDKTKTLEKKTATKERNFDRRTT
jgi:hypothetical protein